MRTWPSGVGHERGEDIKKSYCEEVLVVNKGSINDRRARVMILGELTRLAFVTGTTLERFNRARLVGSNSKSRMGIEHEKYSVGSIIGRSL
jgi:hypothetical protein